MAAGLTRMGSADVDVVVTEDFVQVVRTTTSDSSYHDERNGGQVAARTLPATDGGSVVVANWSALAHLTDAEIERVFAHEAGHASIATRNESHWDSLDQWFVGHWWNRQVAQAATVAIEEFRCEAAVYAAGYQVGPGLTEKGLAEDLFGLNVQLIGADHLYQSHLDVERLRGDILNAMVFHLRYMAHIAARDLHGFPLRFPAMSSISRAYWASLVEPTWHRFLNVYRTIPDAFTPWTGPAATDAVVALVEATTPLMTSFGYEASVDSFWVRLSIQDRQVRLDRANAEAGLLNPDS